MSNNRDKIHINKGGRPRVYWVKRFWGKVYKLDELLDIKDGCWVWTGGRMWKGYGRLGVNGKNRAVHRLSYGLHFGSFDESLMVCHKCDNPSCVKPIHLFLGTAQDNANDRTSKDRGRKKKERTTSIN